MKKELILTAGSKAFYIRKWRNGKFHLFAYIGFPHKYYSYGFYSSFEEASHKASLYCAY